MAVSMQNRRARTGADTIIIDDVSLQFGGVSALTRVSLKVREEEIFAIIGPNGAGKTSLLNCINGFYRPTSGSVALAGADKSEYFGFVRGAFRSGPYISRIWLSSEDFLPSKIFCSVET